MATLYFRDNPKVSREALARKLLRHLSANGLHYHIRTLKRQLSGKISTVPAEVEDAMRRVILGSHRYRKREDIEKALAVRGGSTFSELRWYPPVEAAKGSLSWVFRAKQPESVRTGP